MKQPSYSSSCADYSEDTTTVTVGCCLHSSRVTDLSFSEELYDHFNVRTEVSVLV